VPAARPVMVCHPCSTVTAVSQIGLTIARSVGNVPGLLGSMQEGSRCPEESGDILLVLVW
jgi:hypothetical protein